MSHEQVLQDVEAMIEELKKERDVLNDLLVDLSDAQAEQPGFADIGDVATKE